MDMKLSPPWVKYYNEINSLFGEDPDVTVAFDEDNYKIRLFVDDTDKAAALDRLLLHEKQFGNVTVTVDVIPANTCTDYADLYDIAFRGNDALDSIVVKETPQGDDLTYAVWGFTACQFFNDDISDVNGNCTMLTSDVAKDVMKPVPGLYHCMKPQRR